MALYDSRHRPTTYTIARMADKQQLSVTHSSYWLNKSSKQQKDNQKSEKKDEDSVEKAQTDVTKESGTKGDLSEVNRCLVVVVLALHNLTQYNIINLINHFNIYSCNTDKHINAYIFIN